MKRLCIGLAFYAVAVTYLWLTTDVATKPSDFDSQRLEYRSLKERDDFQWWAIESGMDVSTGCLGAYTDDSTRAAWTAWCARAAVAWKPKK